MALGNLSVPLVQAFESNISNARMIVGVMGNTDLLQAFRLTQQLEDYIIDVLEQIVSMQKNDSSQGSTVSKNICKEYNQPGLPSTTNGCKSQHAVGHKRRGAAGSSRGQFLFHKNSNNTPASCSGSHCQAVVQTTSSEEERTISPFHQSPLMSSFLADEPEPANSPTSMTAGRDFFVKTEPFLTFPSGSVFPGPYPNSPTQNLSTESEIFGAPSEPKRFCLHHSLPKIPVEDVWKVTVCLLPGPEIEHVPTTEQITEWTLAGQGLPQNQDSLEADRRWEFEQFSDFLVNLYPEHSQLHDIGYSFCIADTDCSLIELRELHSIEQLASTVGAGPLYIRPHSDLLPATLVSRLSSAPSEVILSSNNRFSKSENSRKWKSKECTNMLTMPVASLLPPLRLPRRSREHLSRCISEVALRRNILSRPGLLVRAADVMANIKSCYRPTKAKVRESMRILAESGLGLVLERSWTVSCVSSRVGAGNKLPADFIKRWPLTSSQLLPYGLSEVSYSRACEMMRSNCKAARQLPYWGQPAAWQLYQDSAARLSQKQHNGDGNLLSPSSLTTATCSSSPSLTTNAFEDVDENSVAFSSQQQRQIADNSPRVTSFGGSFLLLPSDEDVENSVSNSTPSSTDPTIAISCSFSSSS